MKTFKDNEIIIRPSKILFTLISFSHALLIFLIHILDLYWYFTVAFVILTLLSFYYYSKVYFLRQSKKQVKRLEYDEINKIWLLTLGNDLKVNGKLKDNNYLSNIVLVLNFEIISAKSNILKHKKSKNQHAVAIVFNDSVSVSQFRYLKRYIKYSI